MGSVRAAFGRSQVAGLRYHLTGDLPTFIDSQSGSKHSQDATQLLSIVFIVALLLVAFRALLAPLVTLLPAALVLTLAGPVVAGATHVGVQVSSITQVIVIVLILGAGTDYGIFLVFVCHEHKGRLIEVGRSLAVMLHRRWREVLRSRSAGGDSKPPQAASAQRPGW